MSSADFLHNITVYCYSICATGALCKTSRDKLLNFHCVWPDLLIEITVDFWAFPIHCSVTLSMSLISDFCASRLPVLLMASFRFIVAHNTLANRYRFLSTRHVQELSSCKLSSMPDIQIKEAQKMRLFFLC